MSKLNSDFYLREDVVELSKELIGKELCTFIQGVFCRALITETEAYAGTTDKASHAYQGRYTNRTKIMYAKGGLSYVYLCYGIHYLFNVVTNQKDIPHAILVRAIEPIEGLEQMLIRRGLKKPTNYAFNGPGKLSQARGIDLDLNGESLLGNTIWIEDSGKLLEPRDIEIGPRIGIDYAEEDALLPYRFRLKKK